MTPRSCTIALFCEDKAHESFVPTLLRRVFAEYGLSADVSVITARGGPAKVWSELKPFLSKASPTKNPPDVVAICIDGNCRGRSEKTAEIKNEVGDKWSHSLLCIVPEAHIERWYMADKQAFSQLLGTPPNTLPSKCERDLYKRLLREAIEKRDLPSPSGGIEFGPELAGKMDFFRAGKEDAALKQFIEDAKTLAKHLAGKVT